jgi:hypothetical protein
VKHESVRERYARHRSYGHGPIIAAIWSVDVYTLLLGSCIVGFIIGVSL